MPVLAVKHKFHSRLCKEWLRRAGVTAVGRYYKLIGVIIQPVKLVVFGYIYVEHIGAMLNSPNKEVKFVPQPPPLPSAAVPAVLALTARGA